MNRIFLLLFLFFMCGKYTSADEIDMRDYILLKNGMTEAEVLFRVGPPNHETIKSDHYNYVFSRTWFYIPDQGSNGKWISELKFNADGELISRDRYRVR